MKMMKFYFSSCVIFICASSLSIIGRTPVKRVGFLGEKAKVIIQIQSVFHFSSRLSRTFQRDAQPSPDHDNMPRVRGQATVKPDLDSGSVVTVFMTFS